MRKAKKNPLPSEYLLLEQVLNFLVESTNKQGLTQLEIFLNSTRNNRSIKRGTHPCFITYDKHQSRFAWTKQSHHDLQAYASIKLT